MSLDWNTIIITLLGGTSIISIIQAIRFRKQNLKIKDSEATVSDIEAQKAKMDLVIKFRDEMVTMINIVKESNEKNFSNQNQIIEKLSSMDNRLEKVEIKMSDIESYLNGPYHQWLATKEITKDNN